MRVILINAPWKAHKGAPVLNIVYGLDSQWVHDVVGSNITRRYHYTSINSPKVEPWYHFDMDVAFQLPGGVPIYTFSLLIAFGSVLGLFWISQRSHEKNISQNFQAGIWALLGAAIVGRLTYVAVHWGYFKEHLSEIPQFWLGGISGSSAIAGALLTIFVIASITPINYWELSDELVPLLTTLTISVWLGCWINGCLYGPEVQAWWGIPSRDEWGEITNRWPIQMTGASLTLGIAWVLDQARGRGWLPIPGLVAFLELGVIALTLLWAANFRADPMPQWRNIGLDAWAAIGLIGISLIAIAIIFFQQYYPNHIHENEEILP
jgi:prolipoprotein diacylglyceryltransferase